MLGSIHNVFEVRNQLMSEEQAPHEMLQRLMRVADILSKAKIRSTPVVSQVKDSENCDKSQVTSHKETSKSIQL